MIHIKNTTGIANGTLITTPDGVEIPGITSVSLYFDNGCPVPAEVNLDLTQCDVMAHPLLSRQTLAKSADALGLILIDRNEYDRLKAFDDYD